MKIQIKSDIHLEFEKRNRSKSTDTNSDIYTSPEAEILVLAGDIVNGKKPEFFKQYFGDLKIPIIYVPGNHDYWHGDIDITVNEFKASVRDDNIHVLNRDYKIVFDTIFIGATLWTPLTDPTNLKFIDFEKIDGMTHDRWRNEFIKDYQFIKSTLENPLFIDLKKVVVTHHLPTSRSVPERFKGDDYNIFFSSDECRALMEGDCAPYLWVHGHTHDSCDYVWGNSRVICNPYGYYGYEINEKFNPSLVVEI